MTSSSLPAPLSKSLVRATGSGRITCSARTERALVEAGLAARQGDRVQITAAGRQAQDELLAEIYAAGRA